MVKCSQSNFILVSYYVNKLNGETVQEKQAEIKKLQDSIKEMENSMKAAEKKLK